MLELNVGQFYNKFRWDWRKSTCLNSNTSRGPRSQLPWRGLNYSIYNLVDCEGQYFNSGKKYIWIFGKLCFGFFVYTKVFT